ncbi:transporter substrate-binding domain-containing protein [Clostridium peptidivorans]|uniref:transporter substrate-binding domain-containing protein n=1 Tax=Clostridium peptidivorans TaxID=100174 RepID=UPI0015CEF0E7|nr:transporter substrate-binding domain-containing protein [Clostridium peptidivorans]
MKRNKKNVLIFVLVVSILSLIIFYVYKNKFDIKQPQNVVLEVAGDINFPPFEYLDENHTYVGFNVDLIRAVALRSGIEVKFNPMKWEDACEKLEQGEVDIIQGMKRTTERDKLYDFSEEILTNSQSIFVLSENNYLNKYEDLARNTVAIQKGDVAINNLQSMEKVNIIFTKDQEDAFKKLLNKEVDAFIGNTLTGVYYANKLSINNKLKIVGAPLNSTAYSIAVKKGDKATLELLNKGIKEIKENGTYDMIYRKWFGQSFKYSNWYVKNTLKYSLIAMCTFLVILFCLYMWNDKLKEEVEKKTKSLEMANESLRKKDRMESLGILMAGIAHEIRNPLTSIKTYAELLPKKYDNPKFREMISKDIPYEIERLNNLISELLEYSKPKKAFKENVNIYEIIEKILALISNKIQKEKVKINIDITKDIFVYADKNHLKQIIINLILNGIEALNKEQKSINISAMESLGKTYVTIGDNGCGMDKEELNKIYDPFYTTKASGTGLGLFVCYQLMEENNGKIHVSSTRDEGTSFILEFKNLGDDKNV